MKYAVIAGGVVVVLVLIWVGVFFFLTKQSAPSTEQQTNNNPFGYTGSTVQQKSLPLVLTDGTVVETRDFTKENQPDWAGATSGYLVAGGEQLDYMVLYFNNGEPGERGEFLVTLNKEPLGENRRRAEAAIKAQLEMSEVELCKLAISVSSAPGVSDAYGGKNLGLSFCPGAVALP